MLKEIRHLDEKISVKSNIPFDVDGFHKGYISIPNSVTRSAYGRIQIPIICYKNGDGPTALLIAGNHGDEYEGPVALCHIIEKLEDEIISGRVIILPTLNLPAIMVGKRLSPIDGGNLNRLFPGNPSGTPSEMLANYVEEILLPMSDIAVDLHSGGTSLVYTPTTIMRTVGNRDFQLQQFNLLKAFGGRYTYLTDGAGQGNEATFAAAASRKNVICVTAELGGGASAHQPGIELALNGTLRALHFCGILKSSPRDSCKKIELFRVDRQKSYVLSEESGIFESLVNVETPVSTGQLIARIWSPETPWKAPRSIFSPFEGFIIAVRALAETQRGDCLFQVVISCNDTGAIIDEI